MPRADLPFWIALIHEPKVGPRAMARLFASFENMEAAWKASVSDLMTAGLSEAAANGIALLRTSYDSDRVMNELEANRITALTCQDAEYPPLLREIYDPPPVLFIKGTLPKPSLVHLAVVGSRHASPYGEEVARRFSGTLAAKRTVIVSGLAFGVDEAAHTAALEAKGKTIAVLASGLLNIQTSRSRFLAHKIVEEGSAVVSEFAPHIPSYKTHFPIRNRIISGLCRATLVVEAAIKSGSLITARCAMDQGRDVFAVPGAITSPTSEGTHDLLRQGASIAARPEDLEEALGLRGDLILGHVSQPLEPATEEESRLLAHLSTAPIHMDDLVRASGLTPATALPILTLLSLKGRIRQLPGNYYIIA